MIAREEIVFSILVAVLIIVIVHAVSCHPVPESPTPRHADPQLRDELSTNTDDPWETPGQIAADAAAKGGGQ